MDTVDDPEQKFKRMSAEELSQFIIRLPERERSALSNALADCCKENVLTRGVPAAVLVTGSMYLAQNTFTNIFKNRPFRAPVYIFAALCTIVTTNVSAMRGTCKERVLPLIQEFAKKNQTLVGDAPKYAELRRRNRAMGSEEAFRQSRNFDSERGFEKGTYSTDTPVYQLQRQDYENQPKSLEDYMNRPPSLEREHREWDQSSIAGEANRRSSFSGESTVPEMAYGTDEPPLISGTPTGEGTFNGRRF